MQDTEDECFYFIADLHALTSQRDPEVFAHHTQEIILDWLALGLDPERVTFYRQSDIRAHTELMWILMCLTPMGLLERAHSYKDKTARGLEANAGLFTYPVLMAADILLYDTNKVPVGKDQKQHVEMARDIAQKFNHHYGETFTLPEPVIKPDVMTIPGLDGQKMSKSYGNTIEIFADEKTLKKKIMSLKTDSIPLGEPLDPDTCPVFAFHTLFAHPELETIRARYRAGEIGFGESKTLLFEHVWEYFASARARREVLASSPDTVEALLRQGAEKATALADAKLKLVRDRVGLPKGFWGRDCG